MSAPTLLHLCTPAEWRAALADGALGISGAAGRSLTASGFVHLSTSEQVSLPANRLFAGRHDLVLLAVDAGRIADLRWEPGLPDDPADMVFPHAYGPVPTGAVLAALPYRPGPDGTFVAPSPPPPRVDARTRRDAMAYSVLRRLATAEHTVTGGTAVLTGPVPASHQHNQLLLDGPVGAPQVIAEADRVLGGAGLAHRAATVRGADAAATAAELARHGWEVDHVVSMVTTPSGEVPRHRVQAERALPSELRPFWEASWLRAAPGLTEAQRAQLCDRHELEDDVVDVHAMVVREHGLVVACCLLKVDGATAELDAVETAPSHRGRGLGDALLAGALREAHRAGCDLVWLDADARDWPREWYRRRGFGEVGESWFCRLPAAAPAS
ncbi:GNAT family N-acetyltransferase [Pseudonocardia benzenivorans]|uniref:GNAT family N-acetyltransferase n=1 Tax=Pseudonocardia benzenivorans TaxID=228005 RepID=A0ABW3VNY6_9PSEU|nr:GNAT family N-acetyltransferase [Pseudonocardia dioxanivorans]GJF05378.1 hypothetical protein PSD17_43300 [Pseudonocardia sp. D17]